MNNSFERAILKPTVLLEWMSNSHEWEWEFFWRRPLFDTEVGMAISFLNDVDSKQIHPQRSDAWVFGFGLLAVLIITCLCGVGIGIVVQ